MGTKSKENKGNIDINSLYRKKGGVLRPSAPWGQK